MPFPCQDRVAYKVRANTKAPDSVYTQCSISRPAQFLSPQTTRIGIEFTMTWLESLANVVGHIEEKPGNHAMPPLGRRVVHARRVAQRSFISRSGIRRHISLEEMEWKIRICSRVRQTVARTTHADACWLQTWRNVAAR